jgi:protein SCO1
MRLRRAVTTSAKALLALAACASPALAGLTPRDLAGAGFHLQPGAALPAAAVLHTPAGETTLGSALGGRPALVTFLDYRCRSLCGVVLDELADTLPNMPLALGRDYRVIALGLDPGQAPADAAAFRDQHTRGSALHEGAVFATEDAQTLQQIEATVGLVAPYDAEHGQFAHPAGLILVDAAGRAQRVVSPFALNPFDLKLALTDSGAAPTSVVGRVLQLCYGFNAVTGLYTLRVERILAVFAALTVMFLAGLVGWLLRLERRQRRAAGAAG